MKGFMSFFKYCCDRNHDGVVTFSEVLLNTEDTIKFLQKTTEALQTFSVLLEAAGINSTEVNLVFNVINTTLSSAEKGVTALEKISVTKKDGDYGDINGDGKVDKEDAKLYFQGALDVANALSKAGINTPELQAAQTKLKNMMALIDKLPNRTYDPASLQPSMTV